MRKALNGLVVLSGLLLLVACGNKNEGPKNLSADVLRGNWLVTSIDGKKLAPTVQSIMTIDADLKYEVRSIVSNSVYETGSLALAGEKADASSNSGESEVVTMPEADKLHIVNSAKGYTLDAERITDDEKASMIANGRGR